MKRKNRKKRESRAKEGSHLFPYVREEKKQQKREEKTF